MLWQRSILLCCPDCRQTLPHQYRTLYQIRSVQHTTRAERCGALGAFRSSSDDITQQWPNETKELSMVFLTEWEKEKPVVAAHCNMLRYIYTMSKLFAEQLYYRFKLY